MRMHIFKELIQTHAHTHSWPKGIVPKMRCAFFGGASATAAAVAAASAGRMLVVVVAAAV